MVYYEVVCDRQGGAWQGPFNLCPFVRDGPENINLPNICSSISIDLPSRPLKFQTTTPTPFYLAQKDKQALTAQFVSATRLLDGELSDSFCGLLFHSVGSCLCTNVFNSDAMQSIYFFFCWLCFWCHILGWKAVLPFRIGIEGKGGGKGYWAFSSVRRQY